MLDVNFFVSSEEEPGEILEGLAVVGRPALGAAEDLVLEGGFGGEV